MPGAAGDGPAASPQASRPAASNGASLLAPVLTPYEPHGLGKVVGEPCELGSAAGEPGDRLELLRGGGGDGLRFLGRRLGARLCLPERLADRRRLIRDTAREVGRTLSRPGAARRGFRDPAQVVHPLRRALRHLAQVGADPLEELDCAVERAAGVLGGLPDVTRLTPALLR